MEETKKEMMLKFSCNLIQKEAKKRDNKKKLLPSLAKLNGDSNSYEPTRTCFCLDEMINHAQYNAISNISTFGYALTEC